MAGRKNHPKHAAQGRKQSNRAILARRYRDATSKERAVANDPQPIMLGIDNLMAGNVIPLFR